MTLQTLNAASANHAPAQAGKEVHASITLDQRAPDPLLPAVALDQTTFNAVLPTASLLPPFQPLLQSMMSLWTFGSMLLFH